MAESREDTAGISVISVAERLFSDRGYKSVTVRDIAGEAGMRQVSLYHHFPNREEERFV